MQRALDDASDARDLAKDVLRSLPDYNADDEESTARHDVPVQRIIVENHNHMHSEHDAEAPELPVIKGWPKLTKILVASVALLVSAVVTYLAGKLGAK